MSRIYNKQIVNNRTIYIEYIQINKHVTKDILYHFLSINGQNPDKNDKQDKLIEKAKKELKKWDLKVLPVVFIDSFGDILAIPTVLKGLPRGLPREKQEKALSKANYAKLFERNLDLSQYFSL